MYTNKQKKFLRECANSGLSYGFPRCCVKSFLQSNVDIWNGIEVSSKDRTRLQAAHVKGVYTGFIPCYDHAVKIISGTITLHSLINYNKRLSGKPFPLGTEFK